MSTTDTAMPYAQRVEKIEAVAVAGQNGFFLPWGTYVRPADLLAVEVDGVLWPCAPGNSYVPMKRQQRSMGAWPRLSTDDVVSGVWLVPFATIIGGEIVRITFVVRDLLISPPVPLPVFAPGGVLPTPPPGPGNVINSVYYPTGVTAPNQLVVATRKGLQVEFWRKTTHAGSSRPVPSVPAITQLRTGKHWSPYWRTDVAVADGAQIIEPTPAFFPAGTTAKKRFRLAYYDPSSGARSKLSEMTVFVTNQADRIGVPAMIWPNGVMHASPSVWTGR